MVAVFRKGSCGNEGRIGFVKEWNEEEEEEEEDWAYLLWK